jgi:chemotaxis protein MotB
MSGVDGVDGFDDQHEEHVNHEAWVIPYADMLTLLMALFMMLFAISSIDLQKFEKLAGGLAAELGGGSSAVMDGGPSILDGEAPPVATTPPIPPGRAREELAEQALQREEQLAEAAAVEQRQLDEVERRVSEHARAAGVADAVGFRRESRGLVVTVVADQVMFEPGGATVRPEGVAILAEVAAALRPLPNRVAIEGHTDDVPIHTAAFASNWELSTARATGVLRYLVDQLGVPANRVAAAGYGEQQPAAPNDTPEGRAQNRRVELAVLSELGIGPPG